MWYFALGTGVYGYLFPGNINTMLMSLYQNKRYLLLGALLLLALVFEFAYCFLSLTCYQSIGLNTVLAQVLLYSGCVLGIFFGCWIWLEQTKVIQRKNNVLISRGVMSIVFHPQQITFWLFVFALTRPLGKIYSVAAFAMCDVLGCLLIFSAYILIGSKLIKALKINENHLQKIVGFLYISSSLITLIQMILQ